MNFSIKYPNITRTQPILDLGNNDISGHFIPQTMVRNEQVCKISNTTTDTYSTMALGKSIRVIKISVTGILIGMSENILVGAKSLSSAMACLLSRTDFLIDLSTLLRVATTSFIDTVESLSANTLFLMTASTGLKYVEIIKPAGTNIKIAGIKRLIDSLRKIDSCDQKVSAMMFKNDNNKSNRVITTKNQLFY